MEIDKIIFEEEIETAIFDVIKNAKQFLVLVSPYHKHSDNLRRRLKEAAEKVRIVAVCRKDHLRKDEERAQSEQVRWLEEDLRAKVRLVKGLHAKAYYNESTGIVTSMNLHSGSADNSREIGFIIKDKVALRVIDDYVRGLVDDSEQTTPSREPTAPKTPAAHPPKAQPKQAQAIGFCLACGRAGIIFNPAKPLCHDCYLLVQEQGELEDFIFDHCHLCGHERANISFTKPFCRSCYRKVSAA